MNNKNDKLIRTNEVREMLGGISPATLWRMTKKGVIPEPRKLGGGSASFYKKSDILKIVNGE